MAAILSAIFLFQAVLFDFARVRAAQLQADFATAAAVRSIMSRVNPELREYGLFGLDGEGAMRLVEDIMAENLGSGRGETDTGVRHVRWTETRWLPESARLQFSDYLSEPGIFRIQVLEEMKYRAPIEYMLEVYDKVQSPGVMDNARDAASAARKLEQLEDLVKRLERSLDEAWDVVKELAEEGGLADQFRDANAKSLENIRQLAERLGEHSMEARCERNSA
jgi:polyhydroxyalkanoate synthesis regulator phasin